MTEEQFQIITQALRELSAKTTNIEKQHSSLYDKVTNIEKQHSSLYDKVTSMEEQQKEEFAKVHQKLDYLTHKVMEHDEEIYHLKKRA